MTTAKYDCLCAGIIVADHVCEPIERVPGPGELVLTARTELAIGGCASNVAVDLARLGRRVAVVGRVGDDVFGDFVGRALESAGVDCRHLARSQTAETSGTLIINTRGEDRRFIHSKGANDEFTGREISRELIAGARVLYLGGFGLNALLTAANVQTLFEQARDAGVITVLDVVLPGPADYWSLLRPVLPWTDVFLPNEDEAALITGSDDPLQQAEQFRAAGAGTVVVTCGGRGAVLVSPSVRLRAEGYCVDFVDGTGSGDAFDAGYIHGLLDGCPPDDCLRYGSALGASCVRATGATNGVFNHLQLDEFVATNELSITHL